MEPFTLLLIGGGALWLYNLVNAGNKIVVTITKAGIDGITQGALKVWADVVIDNPTSTAIMIKQPAVNIFLGQAQIGNSIPGEKKINIEANRRTELERLYVQVPVMSIPGGLSALAQGGKLGIEVFTQANGLPYRDFKTYPS